MKAPGRAVFLNRLIAVAAVAALILSLVGLFAAEDGIDVTEIKIGSTPATIYRKQSGESAPVVVIAHGFAGSQQLMQSIALGLAQNGYIAVSFDFPGHGRNPTPLGGSITEEDGATRVLVSELVKIAQAARPLGDGRLAVLGHSMASDIVIRYAQASPDIAATVAISMFSPVVTATTPRNLLVIVGEWEASLRDEAARVVSLATAPDMAEAGKTYGDPAQGTGRRFAVSPHVEHASVLFSRETVRETVAWLDRVFGTPRPEPISLDARGLWILLLLVAVVALARSLAPLLPVVSEPAAGAGLSWRRLWFPLLTPMVLTPLLLYIAPTQFLNVLVADYLALHFAAYGIITAICLYAQRRGGSERWDTRVSLRNLSLAFLAVAGYGAVMLFMPVDRFITSFLPGSERLILLAAMCAGTLCYFLADEWLTRGAGTGRGAYFASKLAFLVSLCAAIALDLDRLFFLIIIIPIIVLFFLVYGFFSQWSYRQTGHPLVAGLSNALAFGWAISVTFPMLAG